MTTLPEKIVLIHEALDAARLPHAFGGALALAWCTGRARGTIDIDVNVFVAAAEYDAVFSALPAEVRRTRKDTSTVRRDGQVRLWWEHTPIDIFLNTTSFHEEAAGRARFEQFMGRNVPFLACDDLAVFKAFFNRGKDWVDIEEMCAAGTLDLPRVIGVLVAMLGVDDERVIRLSAMTRA
ncbi:MAG: hypothetical protein KF911_15550 [Pseudomonadales bacterium]|nr:hypothetical protein [Pseudomonadales bacterium]